MPPTANHLHRSIGTGVSPYVVPSLLGESFAHLTRLLLAARFASSD
jgi:hypothetical protein